MFRTRLNTETKQLNILCIQRRVFDTNVSDHPTRDEALNPSRTRRLWRGLNWEAALVARVVSGSLEQD